MSSELPTTKLNFWSINAPDNWSEEDRARVDRLEAEYDAALDRYFEAMEAAEANARKKMQEESE